MSSNNLKYYYDENSAVEKIEEVDGDDILYSYEIHDNFFIKRFFREDSFQIRLFDSKPIMYVLEFDDYYVVKLKNESELRSKNLFHIEQQQGFLFPCLISSSVIKKLEELQF